MNAAPTPSQPVDRDADIAQNKDIAALSYVWILSVVAFVLRRNSPFVQYHACQGMALFALSIVVWFIPMVGKALELFVLAFAAMGFVFAAQGKWVEVPLVGPLSRGDLKGVRSSWKDFVEAAAALAKSLNLPTPKTSAPPPAATPSAAPAPTVQPVPTASPASEPRSSVSILQPPSAPPTPPSPPVA